MAGLEVGLLKSQWSTPLAISSGPLTRDQAAIERLIELEGVGAIFSKTIYYKDRETPKPTMAKVPGGLVNFDWSGRSIDRWEEELVNFTHGSVPIYASVLDRNTDMLLEMASRLEAVGVKGLEVPIKPYHTPVQAGEQMAALKKSIKLPVIAKIGPNLSGLEDYCKALEAAGVDALSGINTIGPCLVLASGRSEPFLGNSYGIGYLSGPALKSLALETVARISRVSSLPIIAGGGIENIHDVLEFFRVGARAVFLHTSPILQGLEIMGELARNLKDTLQEMSKENYQELVGTALNNITEERKWNRQVPRILKDRCNGCGICVRSCIYNSLVLIEGQARHRKDGHNCYGCGLCITVCPRGALGI